MTSISDRCKTAREKATPGPWKWGAIGLRHEDKSGRSEVLLKPYLHEDEYFTYSRLDVSEPDKALIALAPEAAGEVIRLAAALEDLAFRFGVQVMRASNLHNEEMRDLATEAKDMIWKILNPNGDTND